MHDVRITRKGRTWVVVGVLFLLVVLLGVSTLLPQRWRAGRIAAVIPDTAASPGSIEESAADQARRAAIAALGPIKRRAGTNAADYYREALGLYNGLTDAEKKMLANWRVKGNAKAEAALYAKIQAIMDLIRKGRTANYADWGVGPYRFDDPSTVSANIAVLNSIRNLAMMSAWEANYRFGSDPSGALADLAAMDAMGQSADDDLLGFVIGIGMHALALNVLASNAGVVSGDGDADLSKLTNPAAIYQAYQAGMDGEASAFQALVDEYNDPATQAHAQSLFEQISVTGRTKNDPINSNPAEIASEMQWIEQTEEALGGTLQESDAQFQQWWAQKEAETASMPVAAHTLAVMTSPRINAQSALVLDVMVEAGLALEQGEQAQFQAITDPTTGQPFTYTQTAGGFQLASPFKNPNGKPVTLNFGAPAGQ
jgi:hypothetical protein